MKYAIVIPARGGSKGIPHKNLLKYKSMPLIAHPIKAALKSCVSSSDIWVSSDDSTIMHEANVAGVLWHRIHRQPDDISGDLSSDLEVFTHLLENCASFKREKYDCIVHLRATFPDITAEIINAAVEQFDNNYEYSDSLRSVIRAPATPYKMWHINFDGNLESVIQNNSYHSIQRQLIPVSYWQNACIDIVKVSTILEKMSMIGNRCMPFLMSGEQSHDIDSYDDFLRLIASNKE